MTPIIASLTYARWRLGRARPFEPTLVVPRRSNMYTTTSVSMMTSMRVPVGPSMGNAIAIQITCYFIVDIHVKPVPALSMVMAASYKSHLDHRNSVTVSHNTLQKRHTTYDAYKNNTPAHIHRVAIMTPIVPTKRYRDTVRWDRTRPRGCINIVRPRVGRVGCDLPRRRHQGTNNTNMTFIKTQFRPFLQNGRGHENYAYI